MVALKTVSLTLVIYDPVQNIPLKNVNESTSLVHKTKTERLRGDRMEIYKKITKRASTDICCLFLPPSASIKQSACSTQCCEHDGDQGPFPLGAYGPLGQMRRTTAVSKRKLARPQRDRNKDTEEKHPAFLATYSFLLSLEMAAIPSASVQDRRQASQTD